MEVIPPASIQNPLGIPNPVSTPNQNTEAAPQQEEAPKSTAYRIFDFIRTSIFELTLIALFSILILTTFNYFNLIPLSSVIPALSFLPQQQNVQNAAINTSSQDDLIYFSNNFQNLAACNSNSNDKNIILNQLIKCANPQKFINTDKEVSYVFVPNSDQIVPGNKGVQVNFALKADSNGKNDLGLMFGGDPSENRFYISYYPSFNAWGIQFLFASKITDFVPFYTPSNNSISQRAFFSIKLSSDGKTLTVLFPNGDIESFNYNKSFYTKTGNLPITGLVPKNSELDVYSLNYYTPQ